MCVGRSSARVESQRQGGDLNQNGAMLPVPALAQLYGLLADVV